jgi:hypothetical protein
MVSGSAPSKSPLVLSILIITLGVWRNERLGQSPNV